MRRFLSQLRRHPAYRPIIRGLLILVVLVLVLEAVALQGQDYAYGSPGTFDLLAYWGAGQLMRAGESPYDVEQLFLLERAQGSPYGPIPIWNPPWLLVWIFPLLLLDLPAAAAVWLLASGGLILLSATAIWRTYAVRTSLEPIGIAWLASLLFVPTLFTLYMGQISSLALVGVAGYTYFISRRCDFLAGAALALTTIKPHLVYLVWIAVVWRGLVEKKWKPLAGVAAVLLPTVVLQVIVWPEALAGYRTVLTQPPLHIVPATLGGMLRQLVFPDWPAVQVLVPAVVGVLLLGYLAVQRLSAIGDRPSGQTTVSNVPGPEPAQVAGMGWLLLLSVATAAYGWRFDQLVLLVPFLEIVVWLNEGRLEHRVHKFVIVASLTLMSAFMLVQNLFWPGEQFFIWFPLGLAAVYAYARISRGNSGTVSEQIESAGSTEVAFGMGSR